MGAPETTMFFLFLVNLLGLSFILLGINISLKGRTRYEKRIGPLFSVLPAFTSTLSWYFIVPHTNILPATLLVCITCALIIANLRLSHLIIKRETGRD